MTFDRSHYEQAAIRSLELQGKSPWEMIGPNKDGFFEAAWEVEAHEMYLLRMRIHLMERFHLIVN